MSPDSWITSGRAGLATEIVGSGDPVIFLHANVCDRRMWRDQLDTIGASRKAVAYDRRGFGQTRAEREDFSAVSDLKAVMDATAGSAPAILVGCSQGGRIAIDMALLHPSSVRGLVLIAPSVAGAPPPEHSREIRQLMAQADAEASRGLEQANAVKARLWLDGPLAPEGRVGGEARRLFLEMNGIALRSPPFGSDLDAVPAYQRLGEISVPTLVIWGDLDFPTIQERSRHLASRIPNASGQVLAGAAHLPSLERPAEVTRLVAAFLNQSPGRGEARVTPPG